MNRLAVQGCDVAVAQGTVHFAGLIMVLAGRSAICPETGIAIISRRT